MAAQPIIAAPVDLYNRRDGQDVKIGQKTYASISQAGKFQYALAVADANTRETFVTCDISSCYNVQHSVSNKCIYFTLKYQNVPFYISIVFQNPEEVKQFINFYFKCLFEQCQGRPAKAEDIAEIDNCIAYASLDYRTRSSSHEDSLSFENYSPPPPTSPDGGFNSLLRLGHATNNTMVLRQYNDRASLGLFTADRACQFRMSIPTLSDADGKPLQTVSDILLRGGDHQAILLDEKRPTALVNFDLGRGMAAGMINTVDAQNTAIPVCKLYPALPDDTTVAVGINERDTMIIDPRIAQAVAKHSAYKTNNHFTCAKTTINGYLAVGSTNGIVRLYKEPGLTRATVNFNVNVGSDPIIDLDITPDGEWVLATCPYYLAIFSVKAASTGKLAYVAQMRSDKTSVMRLNLSQDDLILIGRGRPSEVPPFSTAKFETSGSRVLSIIGAIGTAIVTWAFQPIMNGMIPLPRVNPCATENIVDDQVFKSCNDVAYISPQMVSVVPRSDH